MRKGVNRVLDIRLIDSGWAAPDLALLDRLQIRNDGTDIFGVKCELRHFWMAGHDALSQRFFQGFNWITLAKSAKRRGKLLRALPVSAD